MTYLLVTTPEKGHLNPMLGVAVHLRAAGHRVEWLLLAGTAPRLAADGWTVHAIDPSPGTRPTEGPALARLVADPDRLAAWIRALLLDPVAGSIDRIRAVLARVGPRAIGLDPMLYAAVLAAHLEGIPYLGLSSSLNPVTPPDLDCPLVRTIDGLAAERADLFAARGAPADFRICDHLSPHGTVVFSTADHVLPLADIAGRVVLVGPSVPPGRRLDEVDFPWHALDPARPLVYASCGSQVFHQPERFGRIARAAADLGADLVVSAGQLAGTDWARALPGRTIVVDYAPQLPLLEAARVVVTHGGANTVAEALRAGTAILLSPICNDQHLQARFLEAAGAGVVLDVDRADPGRLRRVLARLLDRPPRLARRLDDLRKASRAADGARRAAGLLVGLARA